MKQRIKKILILAANPEDTTRLRLDKEVREIDEGLRRSKQRDQFELLQKWAVRIQDLRRVILDEEPQIIHFSGHGEIDGIKLEDEQGRATLIDPEALAELFEILAEGIECVLLNACYSETQAEAIGKHIPYVIGMKKEIGDEAAIEFSIGFYDGIGAGRSIEQAYKLGCNAIRLRKIPEHLTPVMKKQPGAPDFSLQSGSEPEPISSLETESTQRAEIRVSQVSNVSGGESYQAGRDINIQHLIQAAIPEGKRTKIALWLGMIAAITTILAFALDLPKKIEGAFTPASTRFFGKVIDETGSGVGGAQIEVFEREGEEHRIGQGKTRANGEFSLSVKAKAEETVWVIITKERKKGFEGYLNMIGNKKIRFGGQ